MSHQHHHPKLGTKTAVQIEPTLTVTVMAVVAAECQFDMWVVYNSPADHPGMFVGRYWVLGSNGYEITNSMVMSPQLDDVRYYIQRQNSQAVCLPRNPDDDPVIFEVWV